MTVVVGIRFKDSGKTYFFDPRDLMLRLGDFVIVETVRGFEMAKVAHEQRDVPESEIVGELKPVVRHADQSDFERMRDLQARHEEVLARCAEKVQEHNLPMSLVKAEYSFDGSRLTFYFTAEKRVDFRMLVRDLARTFKSRIELRQIGPRDEAKLLGGIGPCGRMLCCATFLPDYARVSIKMAKDQDLPLNPSKISGICGRLLCCLSYEHTQYIEMRAELPRKGAWVHTPDGPGEVVALNVIKQQVVVQLASSGMQEAYDQAQIQEATEHVGEIARQRVEEGVAPVSRRDRRDRGEQRLLRDEVDQSEILDALALLENHDADFDFESLEDSPSRSRSDGRASKGNSRRSDAAPESRPKRDRPRPKTNSGSNNQLQSGRNQRVAPQTTKQRTQAQATGDVSSDANALDVAEPQPSRSRRRRRQSRNKAGKGEEA
jgi:cell fate regulator YaaT (PSP1 superfamily)